MGTWARVWEELLKVLEIEKLTEWMTRRIESIRRFRPGDLRRLWCRKGR